MSEAMKDREAQGGPTTDGELVAAVLRGERKAFDVLVGRYQRRATELAYHLLNNMDDASEVVQEAFLRAYRKLHGLSAPEKFGSWLLRIVSNQALNYRRGRALRRMASLDILNAGVTADQHGEPSLPDLAAPTPAETASANELKLQIRQAIDELPEKQRLALVLFSIQRLPQKVVAETLNLSVEAVKWHVFTARKKLKEKLKDYL